MDSYSFILDVFVPRSADISRRQSGGNGFVNGQGSSTDSCTNAVVYTLVNGQLFANTTSGATQFGTDPNLNYTLFTPSATPGSINGTFAVDSQNNLMWNNVAFYNNFAQWCIRADNTINAVFVASTLAPSDCVFVQLNMVRCKEENDAVLRRANILVSNCVPNIVGPQVPHLLAGIGPNAQCYSGAARKPGRYWVSAVQRVCVTVKLTYIQANR